jgi:CRISPR system Cascade subunit CasE
LRRGELVSSLHLIHVPVCSSALGRWAAVRKYGLAAWKNASGQRGISRFDEGQALHHLLTELFGKRAIHPYRAFCAADRIHLEVYGYSSYDHQSLKQIARETGLPDALAVCDVDRILSRQMPRYWNVGRRVGFETRVRPVSRLEYKLPRRDNSTFKRGAEIDTFLVEAMRRFPNPTTSTNSMRQAGRTREAVYTDWLAARLGSVAQLCPGVRMSSFSRSRVARTGNSPEGPDAILRGELVIRDPAEFAKVLAKGVGRHKAYGCGMLLLRPAQMV